MIAYINDFYMMMWMSLASVPLVVFMRTATLGMQAGGPRIPPPHD